MKEVFEIIVGKGENAASQHFLLSPLYFNPIKESLCHLRHDEVVVCKYFQIGVKLKFCHLVILFGVLCRINRISVI